MKRSFALLLLGILWSGPYSGPCVALERVKAENREYAYHADLPYCEDGSVTGLITDRFQTREVGYWFSSLTISEIKKIRQRRFRPNGPDLIPRRYCTASAVLSDSKTHNLDYMIIEDASIIGWTYGVEWCVSGLDRSYAYDGGCRAARP